MEFKYMGLHGLADQYTITVGGYIVDIVVFEEEDKTLSAVFSHVFARPGEDHLYVPDRLRHRRNAKVLLAIIKIYAMGLMSAQHIYENIDFPGSNDDRPKESLFP